MEANAVHSANSAAPPSTPSPSPLPLPSASAPLSSAPPVPNGAAAAGGGGGRLADASRAQLLSLLSKQQQRLKEQSAAFDAEKAKWEAARAEEQRRWERERDALTAHIQQQQQQLLALTTQRSSGQQQPPACPPPQPTTADATVPVSSSASTPPLPPPSTALSTATSPLEGDGVVPADASRSGGGGGSGIAGAGAEAGAGASVSEGGALDDDATSSSVSMSLLSDVERLRREALVREYEERLSAQAEVLAKYKGVTLKLHERMKQMQEALNARRSEAEEVGQWTAWLEEQQPLVAQLFEAVLGRPDREQWERRSQQAREGRRGQEEAEMELEGQPPQTQRGMEEQPPQTQPKAAGETGEGERSRSSGSSAAPAPTPSASLPSPLSPSPASSSSSAAAVAHLHRLLSTVIRHSSEVRRMKEESISQLQRLSHFQHTHSTNAALSEELAEKSAALTEAQQRCASVESMATAVQLQVVEKEERLAKSRLLLAKLTKQAEDAKRRMAELTSADSRRQRALHTPTSALRSAWTTLGTVRHWQQQQRQMHRTAAGDRDEEGRKGGSEGGGAKKEGEEVLGGVSGWVSAGGAATEEVGTGGVDGADEELDVDACRPLLRLHLSDGRCWLLLAAHTGQPAAAERPPQPTFARWRGGEGRDRLGQGETEGEGEEEDEAVAAERGEQSGEVGVEWSSSAAASAGDVEGGAASTFLFFTLQSTFLYRKWQRYAAAHSYREGQQQQQRSAVNSSTTQQPFATLLPDARRSEPHSRQLHSTVGTVDDGRATDPHSTSTSTSFDQSSSSTSPSLSAYSSLFSSPLPFELFDSTVLPADALWLCHTEWRQRASLRQSRASATFQSSLRSLQAELSAKEAVHSSLVRDFARYQQRTREALQQKQREVDALTERQEEVDSLRSSAHSMELSLQRLTAEAATRSQQLTALAQQVALLNKEKQVQGEREERLTRLLAVVQEEARQRLIGQEEAELKSAQHSTAHREEEERWKAREAQLQAQLQQLHSAMQRHTLQQQQRLMMEAAQQQLTSHTAHTRTSSSASLASFTTAVGQGGGAAAHSRGGDGEWEEEGGGGRGDEGGGEVVAGDARQQPASAHSSASQSELSAAAAAMSPSSSSSSSSLSPSLPPSSVSAFLLDGASGAVEGGVGGVESALRVRLRSLQSLVQEREILVVQLQAQVDEARQRTAQLQSELRTLQSLQSAESLEYLKNVCTRFMASDDDSLIPVLCTLMGVDAAQQRAIAAQRRSAHRHQRSKQPLQHNTGDRQRDTSPGGGAGESGGGGGGGRGGSGNSSAHFLASFYH